MRKPSVLFIAPSAYPLGGVAVWLDALVRGLEHRGWSVRLGLVAGQFHDTAAYRSWYPALSMTEIHNPTGSREGRVRALEKTIASLKPDVVVSVNIADVYTAAHRLRLRGRDAKVVMALHGISADLLEDLGREAATVDAVIATNRLACRLCTEDAGFPADRVFYAPCGVDVQPLRSSSPAPTENPMRIAWVGRIEQPQKRVQDIPGILSNLDKARVNYRLTLAGDGPDAGWLVQALQPWLEDGRVSWLGALRPADVRSEIYAKSDVLLLTSSWETGPIVIWEAMAAGLAVVTSRYIGSGLEAALQHERNCLMFTMGDHDEAARQLARLAAEPTLCRALTHEAHRLVGERYAIDGSAAAWSEGLEAVIRLPARPAEAARKSPKAAGRLDRLVGAGLAESIRSRLGSGYRHRAAGDEWPHTLASGSDENALLRRAATLDQGNP
jgi:glycosyltransferase involved in cell wall biosynthesis